MKLAMINVLGLASLVLGSAASVEAQSYEVEYGASNRDAYIVVERHESGTIIIEEPAPRVVIFQAPPPRPRRVVVRPEPPCVGAIWVEGYWRHTGVRFVWVHDHWIAPRYGYRFVQPRWHVHAGHHYYTPGYFRPYHAQVRRQPYHRYRPRPGYVYYHGYERPYHRNHQYNGHYKHHKNPNHGHYKHQANRGHHPKPYKARGHQSGHATRQHVAPRRSSRRPRSSSN